MRVTLDSRQVKKGDYFVAVKGETFDGHDYIGQAIKNGAKAVLEESDLYELASNKLAKIDPVVIAITGSVGKTSMRDYIYTILSQQFNVCKGVLNTKLGLATNIVNDMRSNDQFFVAECGMDKIGELSQTGDFIKPKVVVLTNISESHAQKLGDIENIIKAKSELIQSLSKNGVLFFNQTNHYCVQIAKDYGAIEKYGYGKMTDSQKRFIYGKTGLVGEGNYINISGATAVCDYFNVDDIDNKLTKIKPPKGRLNLIKGFNGLKIFDDTYNSSPVSAVNSLNAVNWYFNKVLTVKGYKVTVLGGMLELGKYEDSGHKIVGDTVALLNYDYAILVGELAKKYKSQKLLDSNTRVIEVADSIKAANCIKQNVKPKKGDVILVKASQGIRLEKCVKELMLKPAEAADLLVRQDERWV